MLQLPLLLWLLQSASMGNAVEQLMDVHSLTLQQQSVGKVSEPATRMLGLNETLQWLELWFEVRSSERAAVVA
jgi:hypothetical protein